MLWPNPNQTRQIKVLIPVWLLIDPFCTPVTWWMAVTVPTPMTTTSPVMVSRWCGRDMVTTSLPIGPGPSTMRCGDWQTLECQTRWNSRRRTSAVIGSARETCLAQAASVHPQVKSTTHVQKFSHVGLPSYMFWLFWTNNIYKHCHKE